MIPNVAGLVSDGLDSTSALIVLKDGHSKVCSLKTSDHLRWSRLGRSMMGGLDASHVLLSARHLKCKGAFSDTSQA